MTEIGPVVTMRDPLAEFPARAREILSGDVARVVQTAKVA